MKSQKGFVCFKSVGIVNKELLHGQGNCTQQKLLTLHCKHFELEVECLSKRNGTRARNTLVSMYLNLWLSKINGD